MIILGKQETLSDEMMNFTADRKTMIFWGLSCLFFIAYGMNQIMDLLLFLIFIVVVFFIKEEYFIYISAGLLIFSDAVLLPEILNFSGVSLSRIFLIAFFLRLAVKMLKREFSVKITWGRLSLLLIIFAYTTISFARSRNMDTLIGFLYMIVLIYIYDFIFRKKPEMLSRFIVAFSLFCISSCIYSFLHMNEMQQVVSSYGGMEFERFSGTFEPNFMCLYYNFSIVGLLFLKFKYPIIKYGMLGLFYALMIMTMSITGVIANIAVILLYLVFTKARFLKLTPFKIAAVTVSGLLVAGIAVILFKDNVYQFYERIYIVVKQTSVGHLNTATSGREGITKYYMSVFSNLNVTDRLFGNYVNWKRMFDSFKAAHNTYVDAIYMIGLIGSFFYAVTVGIMFANSLISYVKDKREVNLMVCSQKLIVLISGLTLSFFNSRLFYLFILF